MFRFIQFLSLALCIIASTANSAWAANWVQDPADTSHFIWIDMDSIEVRDGLMQYEFGNSWTKGVPPPADTERFKDAINCTTGEYFRWYKNRWADKREYNAQYHASYDQSGALRTLICNR
ncbi:MAG: hypothetical protein ACREEM_35795 [Blastocatellia bacterium]